MILDNNVVLLAVAILNAVTAVLTWQTHRLTKQIEVATNSMKDQLVKATGEASFAAGKDAGRLQSEDDQKNRRDKQ